MANLVIDEKLTDLLTKAINPIEMVIPSKNKRCQK